MPTEYFKKNKNVFQTGKIRPLSKRGYTWISLLSGRPKGVIKFFLPSNTAQFIGYYGGLAPTRSGPPSGGLSRAGEKMKIEKLNFKFTNWNHEGFKVAFSGVVEIESEKKEFEGTMLIRDRRYSTIIFNKDGKVWVSHPTKPTRELSNLVREKIIDIMTNIVFGDDFKLKIGESGDYSMVREFYTRK